MASSDEGETFEVEEILDQRKRGRNSEYLVRWRGQGEEEDSWEPERNLRKHQDKIDAFRKALKVPASRRSTRQSAASKAESVKQTTKTTTVTRTVTSTSSAAASAARASGAVSESSSPESSPKVTRKTFVERYELRERSTPTKVTRTVRRTTQSSGSGERSSMWKFVPSLPRFLRFTREDIPIVILLACILVIFLTFVFEKK